MTQEPMRIPWKPIEPLERETIPENGALAALDALRSEWQEYLAGLPESDVVEIRRRSLRRLAIETGLLERLYDVDWGLTLTLVSEGFSREAIERSGGVIDDHTRATLIAQRDSLEMVLDFVKAGRELSPSFIRELHAAMTRAQLTYIATDALGRVTELELPRGVWKTSPNHVELKDGRILEYAPPEHVESEIHRLVSMHKENEGKSIHPISAAAWLHHRFVQIHPFADGNGRVARALVLLVLQKHRYAPLVVDRFHRDDYLTALDRANERDLSALVKLFIRLESAALASELEVPVKEPSGVSLEIAHTLAAQLQAAREAYERKIGPAMHERALAVGARIRQWFQRKAIELQQTFSAQGLTDARVFADIEIDEQATRRTWFRSQTTIAARRAGHFAGFGADSGWCGLRVILGGNRLRYVASLHGAGRACGVMAVVTFGELESRDDVAAEEHRSDRQLIETGKDAFRFVHTEPIDSITDRSQELEDLLDEGLSIALVDLFKAAR